MRNMQDESNQRLIMIVDDDQALGEMLSIVLESEGFKTVTCLDGWRAVEMFPTLQPDLMLLDVMLPGLDGVQVAQRIRQNSNTPIIMLTAKSDTTDVVKGLEAGADDYVPKPFEVVELMARIRARLRMPKVNVPAGKDEGDLTERLQCGTLVMDRAEHTATKDGVDLQLTPTEFELLYVLAAHAGEALSRANLLKRVWGYESGGDTRLVNVHVQRLRMKVETDPENPRIVQTVRGIGYKFVAPTVSENLRRQSRWGEIDHHLLDMLQRELQEKYFIVTGNEDDHFWDREYSLKPGIRAEQVPEPLLRFACYVAVSYKVYGMDFQYLDANYLFGLVEKVRPDMVKKLKEHGTGRLPLNLQKRKTEHFTASANDAFAVIRITARNSTEECCHEVLNYLCELLEQEDFPRSYAVEFKGPEKRYLPITGLPKKGVNQLFACAVQYPGLHPLMERYARLAMRQYEQYTNLSDEQCALPGSFAVFALGMLGQEWWQLVWDYLDLCDDEHSHLQEKFLREYVKQFGFTADTVPVFVRGVLSMQNMKYSKDYTAWMANAESLGALLEAKIHLSEIVPSGFSSDEDDDEDEEPAEETEASPEEVLQYAWETVCYVIWGKASAKGGQKVVEAASEELKELYRQIFIPITKNLEGSGGLL